MGLFNKKVSPDERLKQFRLDLRKAGREIERERTRLQRTEGKLKLDMKKAANSGNLDILMMLAKDMVRNRNAMKKFMKLKSSLDSLGLRITLIKAQNGSMMALKGASLAMAQLNRMVNLPQMQHIMQKFMMENEMMDTKSEMMDGLTDDLWDEEGDMEEETALQYSAIFQEMGIPLTPQIQAAVAKSQQPVTNS
ncbi:SNF7 family protein [Trichomonas vaginalis G3]|uniref:SNF7 family protein n=1 Tax=Trichomonas vaginalis (strain ATCC PRA-98 / G3) TaxID=412133 RepID=A2EX23_TRIV3|nr:vacuolar transport [Trichomonas vaginalis G3]EAY02800.1 SNF7 family protein [Trichomonas vaginalis G3]KAI5537566.1 vacuolar transport [Trichomonas vaginalis G3]|eukprot:XP_001315023.1 SNF7 family protein [Trichomonas vaginalis G3]